MVKPVVMIGYGIDFVTVGIEVTFTCIPVVIVIHSGIDSAFHVE